MTAIGESRMSSGGVRHWISRATWIVLIVAAMGVGIVSLRYLLPTVPFPGVPANWEFRKSWVIVHATFSSVAIMTGAWQFLKLKDGTRRAWHRWLGRVYLVGVLVGWVSSVPIALHAQTGRVAQAGFLALGLVWIATGTLAYVTIRKRQVAAHRRWMVRSYALTCAAISLRLMIPLAAVAGYDFDASYPAIAWACWLVNLAVAEVLLRRSKQVQVRQGTGAVISPQGS